MQRKFEVDDIVSANGSTGPLLRVTEVLDACGESHRCHGLFRAVPVVPESVSFDRYEDHVTDFQRVR